MAKITWKGEDGPDLAGPSFTTWSGIRFPKDKSVEITDPRIIAKARLNRFFDVEGDEPSETHDKVSPPAAVEAPTPAPPKPRGRPFKKKSHGNEDEE